MAHLPLSPSRLGVYIHFNHIAQFGGGGGGGGGEVY